MNVIYYLEKSCNFSGEKVFFVGIETRKNCIYQKRSLTMQKSEPKPCKRTRTNEKDIFCPKIISQIPLISSPKKLYDYIKKLCGR